MGPETYADQQLADKNFSENEKFFMKTIVGGVDQYRDFLCYLANALFNDQPYQTSRKDLQLYNIINYLLIFRFSDLRQHELEEFLKSQDPLKIYRMLTFLFDENKLQTLVVDGWKTFLSEDHIQDVIIPGLKEKQRKLGKFFISLQHNVTSETTKTLEPSTSESLSQSPEVQNKKPCTKVQPFNLTKPRPRMMPEPVIISSIPKAQPIPFGLFDGDINSRSQAKRERKDAIKLQFFQPNRASTAHERKPLTENKNLNKSLEKPKTSNGTELAANDKKTKLTIKPFKMIGPPVLEVRHTVASILREDLRIQQEIKAEQDRLQQIEENLHDDTELRNHIQLLKLKEEMALAQNRQERIISTQISHEEALRRQILCREQKHQEAQDYKRERDKQLEALHEQKLKQLARNKEVCLQVQETKLNSRNAKQAVEIKKVKEVEMLKQEWIRQERKRKQEEKALAEKRKELIRIQKENTSGQLQQSKGYDPTETGGHGLISEMSLIEVKKRLAENQADIIKERQERLIKNCLARTKQIENLKEKVQLIQLCRQLRSQRHEQERFQLKEEQALKAQRETEIAAESLVQTADRLMRVKTTRINNQLMLQKEQTEVNLKQEYAEGAVRLVKQQDQLPLQGDPLSTRNRANDMLFTRYLDEKSYLQAFEDRERVQRHEKEEKQRFIQEYDARVEENTRINKCLLDQDLKIKRQQHNMVQTFESTRHKNFLMDVAPHETRMNRS